MIDLDHADCTPILVQRASGLPVSSFGWSTVKNAVAHKARIAAGNDAGSAELSVFWGRTDDPNNLVDSGREVPEPPLAVDDCVRLVSTTIEDDRVVEDEELWVGVVEAIDWSDPKRASVKCAGLGALLARTYTTRGWEKDYSGALLVDPGYLPAFNALPDGDCSASAWDTYFIHDRSGSGIPWTAHRIIDLLLRRGMRSDLPGAPAVVDPIKWRLDPASAGNYTPETIDLNGLSIADAIARLIGARRGLTWRITTADGYAQVLILDLDAAGTPLDTSADLGWTSPRIQERRDGYDYVLVSGARPLVGLTLWWKRGTAGGALEPDGWDPATADTVLDAALLDTEKPYDRPEWRRFKLNPAWRGGTYDGSATGSGTVGLRGLLVDPNTYAPPDGDRWFSVGNPAPAALLIDRQTPAALNWGTSPDGPRQPAVVLAGQSTWEDLSKTNTPAISGGNGTADRSDQSAPIITLGSNATDADALRQAIGAAGTLLVTIGVREWAPLQAAWAAPADAWSQLSPRVYHLRRPGIEEWLCLAGTVKGLTNPTTLDTLASDLAVRSDLAALRAVRDQLAVRFGRSITAASIQRQGEILTDWQPGQILSDLTLTDGRSYPVDMPTVEVSWDFDSWTTSLRWSPLITERPSA